MATTTMSERFLDADEEPLDTLTTSLPNKIYEEQPLVSLQAAIEPLKNSNEVLLIPGTCLLVTGKSITDKGNYVIRLQEEPSENLLLNSLIDNPSSMVDISPTSQVSNASAIRSTTQILSAKLLKKPWLDFNWRSNDEQSIMTPEDLESLLGDPPINVDNAILDCVQGSMVGMALGDALGAHVEFRPRQYLIEHPVQDLTGGGTWGLKKGQFTDDTSMALCLASSLVKGARFL
ncbi:unnamed protein product [Rotaria sordida]|uniref:Uncharacterized protein n=2 Tax=Rotaria sordida TaxID=392033 RepID=A0A815E9T8_9BILA|nr:unnamed protein product [Rotaria sordida]CAF1307179.1 unnamed protein product [Rotaria sordida]